jgi:hypothetical protein
MRKIVKIFFLLTIGLLFLFMPANGQELKCNVQISAQRIQGSNRTLFQNMQSDIYDFMNNTTWTNNLFTYNERIECNLIFTLTEQISSDEFSGTLQIQLKRPVYNSTYNSTVLNFIDNNIRFRYVEFQPLEFDPSTYRSSLVSILAYYAYMIIGFDYDTFSPLGGTEYFALADKIVSNAQSAPEAGWKPYDGSRNKNRYWLVKNILDKEYEDVRVFLYQYHRNGLDLMESRIADARTSIAESLKLIQQVYRKQPDPYLYLLSLVTDAKADELVNIFSGSFPDEKSRVVEILIEIDAANRTKYEKILTAS